MSTVIKKEKVKQEEKDIDKKGTQIINSQFVQLVGERGGSLPTWCVYGIASGLRFFCLQIRSRTPPPPRYSFHKWRNMERFPSVLFMIT